MMNYKPTATDQYLETEVMCAGPVRRLQLLYEYALKAIGKARTALASADIPARAYQVNRAIDIITELALSVDHSAGSALTKELVELYDYVQRRVIEGNAQQIDKPFADAEQVLKTLLDAWKGVPEIEPAGPSASAGYVPVDYGSTCDSFVSTTSSLSQLG